MRQHKYVSPYQNLSLAYLIPASTDQQGVPSPTPTTPQPSSTGRAFPYIPIPFQLSPVISAPNVDSATDSTSPFTYVNTPQQSSGQSPSSKGSSDQSSPPLRYWAVSELLRNTSPYSLPHALTAMRGDPLLYEHQTFKQSSQFQHWRNAMSEEITALHKNQTWHLVPVAPHRV